MSAGLPFADGGSQHSHADEAARRGGEEHADEAKHEDFHGVYQHGVDAFVGRFIVEPDLSERTKAEVNIFCLVEQGGNAHWGYSADIRTRISGSVSIGLEANR